MRLNENLADIVCLKKVSADTALGDCQEVSNSDTVYLCVLCAPGVLAQVTMFSFYDCNLSRRLSLVCKH